MRSDGARMSAPGRDIREKHAPVRGCVCYLEPPPLFRALDGVCAFSQETRGWWCSQNLPPAHLHPPRPRPGWAHHVWLLTDEEAP